MHLVPPVVLFMAKHGLVDNFDTSSLHTIMCGAAPLGEPVTKEVCDRLNVGIRQGTMCFYKQSYIHPHMFLFNFKFLAKTMS